MSYAIVMTERRHGSTEHLALVPEYFFYFGAAWRWHEVYILAEQAVT